MPILLFILTAIVGVFAFGLVIKTTFFVVKVLFWVMLLAFLYSLVSRRLSRTA